VSCLVNAELLTIQDGLGDPSYWRSFLWVAVSLTDLIPSAAGHGDTDVLLISTRSRTTTNAAQQAIIFCIDPSLPH